jgi:hypothetical protein
VKNRAVGFKAINGEIEVRWMANQPRVHHWGLSVGSKIIWLRTRAVDTAVLVGDPALIRQAVKEPPPANALRITLSFDVAV